MAFFVAANNLMTLFLALEWFSISLYILCAIDRDRLGGLEAALKYLVIGGFGSAVLLFGSALVYGSTGKLDFPGIAAAGGEHDACSCSAWRCSSPASRSRRPPRRSTCGRRTSTKARRHR